MAYDGRTKGAVWVYEKLTPESISNERISREKFRFVEDIGVPKLLRTTNEDYRGSGYDRGHLCPAGDCKHSYEAMRDSFLLTNASPQLPGLNRGAWKALEVHVRKLARSGKTVHVYTLPMYLPLDMEGGRFVHYRVIGESDIGVPTHFAKVIIIDGEDQPVAYILPNEKFSFNEGLEVFRTTVEKVERVSGVIFPISPY